MLRDGCRDAGAGLFDRTAARDSGLRRLGPFSAAGVEQPADLGDVHVGQIPHVGHEFAVDDETEVEPVEITGTVMLRPCPSVTIDTGNW